MISNKKQVCCFSLVSSLVDHQLVEPALTKIFNPFMTVMKGFVENDYVTPFLYLTWVYMIIVMIMEID